MIRHAGSYVATVLGFIIGSAVGTLLGLFVSQYLPDNGGSIVGIIVMVYLSGSIGALIGSVIAIWGLLRACEYPAAGATALGVALGWPIIGGLVFLLGDAMGETALWLLPFIIGGICCVARGIALALTPS
jgi:hypothetical protein